MNSKTLIYLAASALMLTACHGGDGHNHEAETHKDEASAHSGEIVISPEKAKAAGIVVDTVTAGEFRGGIPAGGKITAAAGEEATVVATVAGVVRLVGGITEGSNVGKGSTVFTISSKNLQDDPARQAAVAYQAAKQEYERAAKLVDDKIVTQKEFNAIRADYERAKIAYEAFGGNGNGGNAVAVRSPLGGYVKKCLVNEGDYVSVGQPLMTVTQTRDLYLKVNVPERYYAELGAITSAKFKSVYGDSVYSLDQMNGRLVAVGKSTDGGSAYIPVTFRFDNRADVMPGAFVGTFLLTAPRSGVISLPMSALTEEQGLNFVYVQEDASCYERREVKIGQSDGERVEIKSGLTGGEKVVVEGAMQVKLASASNAIPAHTHNH